LSLKKSSCFLSLKGHYTLKNFLMLSGAKPIIKKRITRAIASVINWLTVGNLNAAIIESPNLDPTADKKMRSGRLSAAGSHHKLVSVRWGSFHRLISFLSITFFWIAFCQRYGYGPAAAAVA